ncbi:MAG: hypothetical protein KKF41_03340 [Actinobacteria bacterium]|nr:hypothetical protein [Actinomycetota bacterium]MBU1945064.1 hypothetical protein [Actinomycetota bacterium]MBU2686600.1 hypothetical protein [Actinomycetota bacterium]
MTREPQTRKVDRSTVRVFWNRSLQCRLMMEQALAGGKWEAAGVNAVHAAIAGNDAVLAALRGLKSVSADHHDAARLFLSQFTDEDAQKAGKRLSVILAKKSRVEYDEKRFTEKEAPPGICATRF